MYAQYVALVYFEPNRSYTRCFTKINWMLNTQEQFYAIFCLLFSQTFESSIFSKIPCLLGEQDKHYSETDISVV